MGSNIIELVKSGHEQAAELKASCGAVDVRSVAQLISDLASQLDVQLARSNALAAENAGLKEAAEFSTATDMWEELGGNMMRYLYQEWYAEKLKAALQTPSTDAFLAEVRAQAHKEGAYFVANRMLAAWDAGFIDDTAKNAADIARMILTSTEFMADAPEGDFDRSFADGVLEGIAAQLRKGVQS
ncbi:hypothetical protein A4K07_14550 [Salmonella enterica subsp. enterica serovar Weltevreden]|nr:hypothetical protein [Salmonella enterica subsp. enterica serovar Weltevreden]